MVESCTISRWRGYVSSTFVALVDDGTRVAESPAFRHRGQAAPPDSGAARHAYDELRAELERLGWEEVAEQSATWCAGRFTRMVSVPVARPVAEAQVAEAPVAAEPQPRLRREAPVHRAAPPRPEPLVEPAPRAVEEVPATPPAAQSAPKAPWQSRTLSRLPRTRPRLPPPRPRQPRRRVRRPPSRPPSPQPYGSRSAQINAPPGSRFDAGQPPDRSSSAASSPRGNPCTSRVSGSGAASGPRAT